MRFYTNRVKYLLNCNLIKILKSFSLNVLWECSLCILSFLCVCHYFIVRKIHVIQYFQFWWWQTWTTALTSKCSSMSNTHWTLKKRARTTRKKAKQFGKITFYVIVLIDIKQNTRHKQQKIIANNIDVQTNQNRISKIKNQNQIEDENVTINLTRIVNGFRIITIKPKLYSHQNINQFVFSSVKCTNHLDYDYDDFDVCACVCVLWHTMWLHLNAYLLLVHILLSCWTDELFEIRSHRLIDQMQCSIVRSIFMDYCYFCLVLFCSFYSTNSGPVEPWTQR